MTRPILNTPEGTEDFDRFTQIPRLEYSDEGSVAVNSVQNRVISDRVERVVNEWHTFVRGFPATTLASSNANALTLPPMSLIPIAVSIAVGPYCWYA